MKGHYNFLKKLLFAPIKKFSELLDTVFPLISTWDANLISSFEVRRLLEGGVYFDLSMKRLALALREKFPYSELFWSIFSRIWTEYGDMKY